MRKLLPYEHQLIEALGVTKDEYLNFVAIQQDYKDPKVGTALDVRNTGTEVAIVLTIVGTLFQVGAALLAPKPEIPDVGNRSKNRQQRFAPSFGFNSVQDLAKYGDPVNLIYTNNSQNPFGSVRANGSLVWSAIENFGSSQFMQLMIVIGASKLKRVEPSSIAFGQKHLSSLDKSSFFVFSKINGEPGIPEFRQLRGGYRGTAFFPRPLAPTDDEKPACMVSFNGDRKIGFSQAYTPTTATKLGVFDAVPINVNVYTRDKDGDSEASNILIKLGIFAQHLTWKNRNEGGIFQVGDQVELIFTKAKGRDSIEDDKIPGRTAIDMRRQMVESLDFSSTYMLGAAKFRFETYLGNGNKNLEVDNVNVVFQCIEPGAAPTTAYILTSPNEEASELKREIENAIHILSNTPKFKEVATDTIDPKTGNPVFDTQQIIPNVDNHPLSDQGNFRDPFVVTNGSDPRVEIRYNTIESVAWTPELNLVGDNGAEIPESTYQLRERSVNFNRFGSIEYSKEQKADLMESLTIEVNELNELRETLGGRRDSLRALIDDIQEGVFDEDIPWGNNGYDLNAGSGVPNYYGRDPDERSQNNENKLFNVVNGTVIKNLIDDGFTPNFDAYDKKIIGRTIPYRGNDDDQIYFTFIYIDRHRNWRFFSFNGIVDAYEEGQDKSKPFLLDEKLNNKKSNLKDAKRFERDLEDANASPEAIESAEGNTEAARTKRNKRLQRNYNEMHKQAITVIKDDIKYLDSIIEQLPSTNQADKKGRSVVRRAMNGLIREKQDDLETLEGFIKDPRTLRERFNDTFFSKCLVKAETASYETVSEIDTITFSLKVKLFRRISGRKKGKEDLKDYSASDNGVKSRMAFFRMFYKRQGDSDFEPVLLMFAVRRGSESDFYTQIRFKGSNGTAEQPPSRWSFKFEPVYDPAAEFTSGFGFEDYAFLEDTTEEHQVFSIDSQTKVSWSGRKVAANSLLGYFPDEDERGPIDTNEWDMFSVNSDTNIQFSHEAGPEITLTAVTEQQFATQDVISDKYKTMTMIALGIYSNRGLQELRSVSALVKKGKDCKKINVSNNTMSNNVNSSSFAPDIFADTLLDRVNGVGKYINSSNVDIPSLALAKQFCTNNNLPRHESSAGRVTMFMDGIIADAGSWREFWINAAPFSLLELARKNGKDTLVPALPVNDNGEACRDDGTPIEINVSALFTTGNILQDSYKEEFLNYSTNTEDLIASVIYREFKENDVFNRNRTVDVRLAGVGDEGIRETFDLSQFVTQKEQAVMFGKLLCNQRRYIRKGIEFRTFPSEAALEPGAFIYVDIGLKHWDRYSSGVVMKDGLLNAPLMNRQDEKNDEPFEFLLHKPLTGETESESAVSVSTANGISTATFAGNKTYEGWMFVMGEARPTKRVFRVTELAIEEGGELSVKAIEYPCNGQGRAEIADFRSSNFEVS